MEIEIFGKNITTLPSISDETTKGWTSRIHIKILINNNFENRIRV